MMSKGIGILLAVARLLMGQEADLVLTNGRIWTGSEKQPWAEALAIRRNRIVAAGSNEEVRALPGKRVIDLGGKLAVPGFNDAHIHFLSGALGRKAVDLIGARNLEEIQKRVAEFARAHPEAGWITGAGWEYGALPGQRLPRREDLDAAVKDRPVFLRAYDGHTGWANTKALETAGVTRSSRYDGFGEVARDAQGAPTGALKEGAQRLVEARIPQPGRGAKLEALEEAMRLAASLGITSIQNASGDAEEWGLYQELEKAGKLTLRARMAMSAGPRDVEPPGPAVKFVLDGVIETHTAAMIEPYADAPGVTGKASWEAAVFWEKVARFSAGGAQVWAHAIGDRAVRTALDAFSKAGSRGKRHRIEHIETVASDDVPRFAKLGVLASMMPIHGDPGTAEVWSRAVGEKRLPLAFAWRSLEQAGARLVFSSDWPATISLDPMRGLHCAVNRRTLEGQPAGGWVPEQRVSLETALRAYTAGGAFASFEEKVKGKLEPGMLADVVVLSQDLFRMDAMEIGRTKVEMTVFDGRVVYDRGGEGR